MASSTKPAHTSASVRRTRTHHQLVKDRRSEREVFVRKLRDRISQEELDDVDVFATLVRLAVSDYGLEPKKLAEVLNVNASAITRWAKGDNAPRPYARPTVISIIADLIEQDLDDDS